MSEKTLLKFCKYDSSRFDPVKLIPLKAQYGCCYLQIGIGLASLAGHVEGVSKSDTIKYKGNTWLIGEAGINNLSITVSVYT